MFMIATKVTLSMTASVNITITFKYLEILQWIDYVPVLASPQGNLKCYYIILLHACCVQWCLNGHQTVAWVSIMLRWWPAQLAGIVSLLPPPCICVSSLVLTAQHTDHLSGLSAHAEASLIWNKGSYAFKKNPIYKYIQVYHVTGI